jgi:hypothetical protein
VTDPFQEDLFGNTVALPDDCAPQHAATVPHEAVNDMGTVQAVLAHIVDGVDGPLHLADDGRVRRCQQTTTAPVPAELATVVRQLLTARYLTTRTRSCRGHGALIVATETGRSAAHRWRAYRRPTTW